MKYLLLLFLNVFIITTGNINAQQTLTNSGASISVYGENTPSALSILTVIGDYENQTDINGNNGSIDLTNNARMNVSGNWVNNSFSNVFSQSSSSLTDGTLILGNKNNAQIIGGISPTFFENLIISGSKKILTNENNSVNQSLIVDAPLILNSRTFEIKNPNPSGIIYYSGFIKSETLPGNLGYIKWDTKNTVALFSIPFGSGGLSSIDNLKLDINIQQPMSPNDYFKLATYHTDMFNQPMPSNASPLELSIRKVADRYWLIKPKDKTTISPLDITFSYANEDISRTTNSINPDRLKASRNNTDINRWMDMKPRGTHLINTVTINDLAPNEFYPIWTLVNLPPTLTSLFVSNAFSPNGDGLNDYFFPIFQVDFEIITYELVIYDRWGNIVFRTKDINQGWDGKNINTNDAPQVGLYTWVIIVTGRDKDNTQANGRKQRFTGKVTLIL